METLSTTKAFSISCDDCSQQATAACEGCVVSFICDREPSDALIVDAAEARAVRMLSRSGLIPPLRHHRRAVAVRPVPRGA